MHGMFELCEDSGPARLGGAVRCTALRSSNVDRATAEMFLHARGELSNGFFHEGATSPTFPANMISRSCD